MWHVERDKLRFFQRWHGFDQAPLNCLTFTATVAPGISARQPVRAISVTTGQVRPTQLRKGSRYGQKHFRSWTRFAQQRSVGAAPRSKKVQIPPTTYSRRTRS